MMMGDIFDDVRVVAFVVVSDGDDDDVLFSGTTTTVPPSPNCLQCICQVR